MVDQTPDSDPTPILEVHGLTKRFSGIVALDNVSLRVHRGELVALIGPNGAGKTTIFDCLSGALWPDDGDIRFDGSDLTRLRPAQRARAGLARTFQRLELFAGMTVRDHLLVGARAHRRRGGVVRDLLGRSGPTAAERQHTDAMVALLGLDAVADRPADSLPLGIGRLVELGRALMCEPLLLFLDEPSSGLDHRETDRMCEVLQQVTAERGTAVLLVEHDVAMVQRLATRAYVLDLGRLIAEGPPHTLFAQDAVRAAYLGIGVGT